MNPSHSKSIKFFQNEDCCPNYLLMHIQKSEIMIESNIHLSFTKGCILKPSLLHFECGNACFF